MVCSLCSARLVRFDGGRCGETSAGRSFLFSDLDLVRARPEMDLSLLESLSNLL